MTDNEDTDTRKIEKRRSWKEIASSATSPTDPSVDDYAIELDLFERGDIDKSLWAKHLVEAKGDENEAKWLYVKERVVTAPARRTELEIAKKEEEKRAFAENQRRQKQRAEAERKAAEEAERQASEEREAVLKEIGQARVRKHEERDRAGLVVDHGGKGVFASDILRGDSDDIHRFTVVL